MASESLWHYGNRNAIFTFPVTNSHTLRVCGTVPWFGKCCVWNSSLGDFTAQGLEEVL